MMTAIKLGMACAMLVLTLATAHAADTVYQDGSGTDVAVQYIYRNSASSVKGDLSWQGSNSSGNKNFGLTGYADHMIIWNQTSDKDIVFGLESTERIRFMADGRIKFTGSAPSVSSQDSAGDCGTSPSVAGNDSRFDITVGSSTNAGKCKVTFAATQGSNTGCFCQNITSGRTACGMSPGTTTVSVRGRFAAGDVIQCHCNER